MITRRTANRRWRRGAVAGVVALTAALLSPTAGAVSPPVSSGEPQSAPDLRCRARILPAPDDGPSVGVATVDPTGRWSGGWSGDGKDVNRPVRWHHDVPEILPTPLDSASVRAINRHGDAVGDGWVQTAGSEAGGAGRRSVAFAFVDGRFVRLAKPSGTLSASPSGIASDGTISGWAFRQDGYEVTVLWPPDEPDEPVVIDIPDSISARAVGISAHGRIAVLASTEAGRSRSYLVSATGRVTRLYGVHAEIVEVASIANGWAAAFEQDREGSHLTRIDLRNDQAEAVVVPGFEFWLRVNNDGILAGRDLTGGVIYTDRVVNLPLPEGAFDSIALAIDNAGNPAGVASLDDGTGVAVRWTC